MLIGSGATPLLAQTVSDAPQAREGQPPVTQPSTTSALPEQTAAPAPSTFQRYDDLGLKGWVIPFPKSADTIVADKGGVRDWLADRGIGVLGVVLNTFQYDTLQNDHGYKGPQLYNGQDITRTSTAVTLYATYDLNRIGLHDAQLSTTLTYLSNSFRRVDGPHMARIARLNYYQSFAGGKVELKLGITDNGYEFLGTNVGGSLATGNLGPLATIPYQVGLSYGAMGVPAANVRVNFKGGFYDKLGVQRSLPPGGANAEYAVNKSGFNFFPHGTGVLTINELGYNRASALGRKSMWVRGGGIYNTTNYTAYAGGTKDNWALYAAVDRQLTQPDSEKPFRGAYGGFTTYHAPPEQNLYTHYYEGRLYDIGLLRQRPFDLASIVASYTSYSKAALAALTQLGKLHSSRRCRSSRATDTG